MMEFVKTLIISGGTTIVALGILASLFLAIGYLGAPGILKGIDQSCDRIFDIDDWLLGHRIFMGLLFVLIAVALSGILYISR